MDVWMTYLGNRYHLRARSLIIFCLSLLWFSATGVASGGTCWEEFKSLRNPPNGSTLLTEYSLAMVPGGGRLIFDPESLPHDLFKQAFAKRMKPKIVEDAVRDAFIFLQENQPQTPLPNRERALLVVLETLRRHQDNHWGLTNTDMETRAPHLLRAMELKALLDRLGTSETTLYATEDSRYPATTAYLSVTHKKSGTNIIAVLRPGSRNIHFVDNPPTNLREFRLKTVREIMPPETTDQHQVIAFEGRPIGFNILSQTPAKRKFTLEQEHFETAVDNDSVTLEWIFLPFYPPTGHTVIRIGNMLFSFGHDGWKKHVGPRDNAKAFLFNNPRFKKVYSQFRSQQMPPASVGLEFKVNKEQADAFIQNIDSQSWGDFRLYTNNCNHCLVDNMIQTQMRSAQATSLRTASSVIAFRQLLREFSNPTQTTMQFGELNTYPIANTRDDITSSRQLIPLRLIRPNSKLSEIIRSIGLHFLVGPEGSGFRW